MSRQFPWVVIKFLRRHRRPARSRRLTIQPGGSLEMGHGLLMTNDPKNPDEIYVIAERERRGRGRVHVKVAHNSVEAG